MKKLVSLLLCLFLGLTLFTGCGSKDASGSDEKVIIYSNADDEAIEAMSKTLDENGYKDKYMFQTFGTSELGGKLIAEGTNIEADMVTMSSFYLDSAQEKNKMFKDLTFDVKTKDKFPSFYAPITSQEGTIIVNTDVLKENNLPMPKSIKDLTKDIYKDNISVTDIQSSSTAWLLIQAIISEYGEEEGAEVLTKIYENAGPHIEDSGSGPIKKVRSGEVAIGFGLRQQAVSDKKEGLSVDYVDPTEGNFSLTESVAVIDKGEETNPLCMEIADCIINKGRSELMKYYPNAVYEGETTNKENASKYPKVFKEKLSADLLKQHQEFSEKCKQEAAK